MDASGTSGLLLAASLSPSSILMSRYYCSGILTSRLFSSDYAADGEGPRRPVPGAARGGAGPRPRGGGDRRPRERDLAPRPARARVDPRRVRPEPRRLAGALEPALRRRALLQLA